MQGFGSLMRAGRTPRCRSAGRRGARWAQASGHRRGRGGRALLIAHDDPVALAQTARHIIDDVYQAPGQPRLRIALHHGEVRRTSATATCAEIVRRRRDPVRRARRAARRAGTDLGHRGVPRPAPAAGRRCGAPRRWPRRTAGLLQREEGGLGRARHLGPAVPPRVLIEPRPGIRGGRRRFGLLQRDDLAQRRRIDRSASSRCANTLVGRSGGFVGGRGSALDKTQAGIEREHPNGHALRFDGGRLEPFDLARRPASRPARRRGTARARRRARGTLRAGQHDADAGCSGSAPPTQTTRCRAGAAAHLAQQRRSPRAARTARRRGRRRSGRRGSRRALRAGGRRAAARATAAATRPRARAGARTRRRSGAAARARRARRVSRRARARRGVGVGRAAGAPAPSARRPRCRTARAPTAPALRAAARFDGRHQQRAQAGEAVAVHAAARDQLGRARPRARCAAGACRRRSRRRTTRRASPRKSATRCAREPSAGVGRAAPAPAASTARQLRRGSSTIGVARTGAAAAPLGRRWRAARSRVHSDAARRCTGRRARRSSSRSRAPAAARLPTPRPAPRSLRAARARRPAPPAR